jgi:CHRD domain
VPEGTKLTDDQYKSYKAGNLYVNVHTDAHKGGEIRAQISP